MAATKSKSKSKPGAGRRASEKTEKYRFAQNLEGQGTAAEREYRDYALEDSDSRGEPDVLLDVPVVKVDSIHLEVDDLDAHVELRAKVLDLVKLNAGVDVHLGKLRLDIKGVEAQALLKVRLDHVAAIVDRVLTTLDRNPELVKSLGRTVEQVGQGAGHALDETGGAVEEIGEGAGDAVQDVGSGAGQAVGDIGEGAGQAVGDIGEGAGQAVGDVGQGAGQAVGEVGEGAGQAVGDIGEGAGETLGELEQVVSGTLQSGGDVGGSTGDIAKLATKIVAQQLMGAAAEEARELGLAATRKALEVGERRRQRRADELNATEAALRKAEELEVDIEGVEGSGPEGRITIRDVREAAEA
ncbi:MAG TPA: E3 binding domain-containing protein [Thermoleophilaceae bacterium]|nr:E3 binding domain-containing protein [Thermoleophilaceae bacterium]